MTAGDTQQLLSRLRSYLLPGGDDAARSIQSMRATERGEIQSAPTARAVPFTADETIETSRSAFRWDARMTGGKLGFFRATDAYEDGHGRLVISLGGIVPVKKMTGPAFDKGELQRYLAYAVFCPPILVNHATLEWTATGPDRLRVRDRDDATDASVEFEIDAEGRPIAAHAIRPRDETGEAPWSATTSDFEERDGIRVARRLTAAWELPGGTFTYFTQYVDSFAFTP